MKKFISVPSVVSGIIASLFVIIFIDPILDLTWKIFSSFAGEVWVGLVNKAYENASLGNRSYVDHVIFYMIYSAAVGLNVSITVYATKKYLNLGKEKEEKERSDRWIKNHLRALLGSQYVTGLLLIVFGAILLSAFHLDLQLNSSFQRRIAALAPELSQNEVLRLKADWALMSSKEDYIKIRKKMEELAKEKGVILPKSLID